MAPSLHPSTSHHHHPPSVSALNALNPTLKRQRSTSNPPSPTGSTSSKKAASEDNFDSTRPDSGYLFNPSSMVTTPGGPGSSPLRADVDEGDIGDAAWVKRTEDVHLSEAEPDEAQKAKYAELYNILLSESPPPFKQNDTYYLIPRSLHDDLKAAGFGGESSKSASAGRVTLDMSGLLADPEGEEVSVIGTAEQTDGSMALLPSGSKQRVWSLKPGLSEDEDFAFITKPGWEKLSEGLGARAGPSLGRFGISNNRVQLVPPVYALYIVQQASLFTPIAPSPPIRLTCPTETPIPVFLRFMRSLLSDNSDRSPFRIWQFDSNLAKDNNDKTALAALKMRSLSPSLLPALASKCIASSSDTTTTDTCASLGLESGDSLVLEFGKKVPNDHDAVDWILDMRASGEAAVKMTVNMPPVPTAPPPLFSSAPMYAGTGSMASSVSSLGEPSSSGMMTRSQVKKPGKSRGLVGLGNLGNTCFMNSATQCLSNTHELCDYFLSGVYRDELNRDNPLGMYGQVAESFGGVIEALWSSNPLSSFSPRQLKQITSKFAPQFAGYGQHDTQEFIAFLLDGLHEDLNRIKKKPYIEKPDWKPGGGDRELAELGRECWDGYKKRNDSVIVDLFQGQLMSTLVCPECHKESITMDPFMYLTVPLPIAQHREFKLDFVPRDPEKPMVKVKVLIPATASFMQLKEKLAILMKCSSANLIGFDLWKGGVYNWWLDGDHHSEAKEHDVPVFHDLGVPASSSRRSTGTTATDGSITVPVYTFKTVEPSRGYSRDITTGENSLQPFFITLSKAEAENAMAVREAVAKGYSRFVRSEMQSGMWVPSTSHHAAVPPPIDEERSSQDTTTEIHIDGDTSRILEVPSRSPEDAYSRPQSPANELKAGRNGSSASLATLGSVKSGRLVPRGDLYKIHVADASTADKASNMSLFKSKDSVIPLYKGTPSGASAHWSLLESRRKARKGMMSRMASGISSMVGSSHESESPRDGAPPEPVIRPGEGIFCEWSPKRYAEYLDESPSTVEVIDPAIEKERAKKKEGRTISIEDCLDEFSREETLGQDDLWYCPVCKKHQAATKKLEIYKAPDILVICIKRFGSSRRLSDKLDNLVGFPVEGLDLNDRIGERRVAKTLNLSDEEASTYGIESQSESWTYDLYAVDNHFGGLGGGHYTAFCKNKDEGEWYNFDDSRVSKASENAVQSRAAYLLFYRRRTVRPIGGISRLKAEEANSRNVSRAASPTPSSPHLGHSGLRHQIDPASSAEDTPTIDTSSSDELPSYSAQASLNASPAQPSPAVSANGGGMDQDVPDIDITLSQAGQSVGYGNSAWGRSSHVVSTSRGTGAAGMDSGGVSFGFGSGSFATSHGNSQLPSPPASDDGDGFEKVRSPGPLMPMSSTDTDTSMESPATKIGGLPESEGMSASETGLGEEYGMVNSTNRGNEAGTDTAQEVGSDVEMRSASTMG